MQSPHPKDISSGPCLAIFSKGGSLEINVVRISSKREREKNKKEIIRKKKDRTKERKKGQEENEERKGGKIRKERESLGFLS